MMLGTFVAAHGEEILTRCRQKTKARALSLPTSQDGTYGVPRFLDQLVDVLGNSGSSSDDIAATAALHGGALRAGGFTVSQVVHVYGDVCQAITDLAFETATRVSVEDFRTLNRCLDDAIASAVTGFGVAPSRPGADTAAVDERIGFLAHEIRNLVNTATVAFEVLSTGDVGVRGSTGNVLKRTLSSLRDLVNRSLDDARLGQETLTRVPVVVAELVEELSPAARLEASHRGLDLTLHPGEPGLAVSADRKVLAAIVVNLLQNAFKFTGPQTCVVLSVTASADRVLIDVADECGGLSDSGLQAVEQPWSQASADQARQGLGLAYSRWAAEAHDGSISVRNVAGRGCVFTVDLPRTSAAAVTTH